MRPTISATFAATAFERVRARAFACKPQHNIIYSLAVVVVVSLAALHTRTHLQAPKWRMGNAYGAPERRLPISSGKRVLQMHARTRRDMMHLNSNQARQRRFLDRVAPVHLCMAADVLCSGVASCFFFLLHVLTTDAQCRCRNARPASKMRMCAQATTTCRNLSPFMMHFVRARAHTHSKQVAC